VSRRPWTDRELENAAQRKANGQSIDSIARDTGRSYDSVRDALRGKGRRSAPVISQADKREVSVAEISEPYAGAAKVAEPNTVMGKVRRVTARIGSPEPGARYYAGHGTDFHFGSSHCDANAILDWLGIVVTRGVHAIIVTGDVLDGVSEKLIMEQRGVGFERQADEAVEVFTAAKLGSIPVIAITGNHDGYFNDIAGMDAGRALSERMQKAGIDWRCVGSCMGRAIVHGAKFELYHPHGGGATRNAVRRVLNAKAERYEVDDRPDFLMGGHFHKHAVVHAYPEDILCVGGGTFQRRESDFGVRMIHPWDIGGGIVSWSMSADGRCVEKASEFFNVRPEVRGWAA
jgi:predicted phosphodiesterase